MITDMKPNKKLSPIGTELILREKTQYSTCFRMTILFKSASKL